MRVDRRNCFQIYHSLVWSLSPNSGWVYAGFAIQLCLWDSLLRNLVVWELTRCGFHKLLLLLCCYRLFQMIILNDVVVNVKLRVANELVDRSITIHILLVLQYSLLVLSAQRRERSVLILTSKSTWRQNATVGPQLNGFLQWVLSIQPPLFWSRGHFVPLLNTTLWNIPAQLLLQLIAQPVEVHIRHHFAFAPISAHRVHIRLTLIVLLYQNHILQLFQILPHLPLRLVHIPPLILTASLLPPFL